MRFGSIDVPDNIGLKPWDWFVKYYESVIKGKAKEKPETIYKKLGGTPPKKESKEGAI